MNDYNTNKPIVEYDFLMSHEFTIDRPAKEVWSYMTKLGAWMPTHKLVTVEGSPGKEGELVKVFYPKDSDISLFYLKVIKLSPCKNMILKMMPLDGEECDLIESDADLFRDLLGYENFTLVELNGVTKLIFQSTAIFRSSDRTKEEMNQFINAAAVDAKKRWQTVYEPKLRELVLQGG